jgi:hypothetical protein
MLQWKASKVSFDFLISLELVEHLSRLFRIIIKKSYTPPQFSFGTRHAVASNQVITRLETKETSVEIKQPRIANSQQGS